MAKRRRLEPKPSQERVMILLDPTGRPALTSEYLEEIKVWTDVGSRPVQDVIRTLGGAVIHSSLMDSRLTAWVPEEDLEAHLETIKAVDNVSDAYVDPIHKYRDEGWY